MDEQEQLEQHENRNRHQVLRTYADGLSESDFDAIVEPHFKQLSHEEKMRVKKKAMDE